MAYNGRLRAWVIREKWKALHIDHTQRKNKNDKIITKYNFNSGFTKKIWDAIIDDLRSSGIPINQIPTIMGRSGLSIASIKRKMEGKEETHLYELEPILQTFNFKIRFNYSDKEILRIEKVNNNYTYKQELNKIIIRRNLYPKFFINFNPDKPTDFEIDFHEEIVKFPIPEFKMVDLVMSGIQTFYKEEKKELQRKMKIAIRNEIRRQFLNGEILTKLKSKNKLK